MTRLVKNFTYLLLLLTSTTTAFVANKGKVLNQQLQLNAKSTTGSSLSDRTPPHSKNDPWSIRQRARKARLDYEANEKEELDTKAFMAKQVGVPNRRNQKKTSNIPPKVVNLNKAN